MEDVDDTKEREEAERRKRITTVTTDFNGVKILAKNQNANQKGLADLFKNLIKFEKVSGFNIEDAIRLRSDMFDLDQIGTMNKKILAAVLFYGNTRDPTYADGKLKLFLDNDTEFFDNVMVYIGVKKSEMEEQNISNKIMFLSYVERVKEFNVYRR